MKFKTALFAVVSIMLLGLLPKAGATIINLTISPVSGDNSSFLLQASGDGTASSSSSSGSLFFDGVPFDTTNAVLAGTGGLSYGGETLDILSVITTGSELSISLSDTLSAGGPYSFSGDGAEFGLTSTFTDTFNAGTYNIINESNPFITDSGTLTILSSPIPEPSTYAALAGIAALGVVMVVRRRRK